MAACEITGAARSGVFEKIVNQHASRELSVDVLFGGNTGNCARRMMGPASPMVICPLPSLLAGNVPSYSIKCLPASACN